MRKGDIIDAYDSFFRKSVTAAESNSQLRVLVVDDDSDIRELVSAYFARQGISVLQAGCEADVIATVKSHAPDVILLDVNLGNEDGFAIARRLRALWAGGLLMVTGRSDTVDRVVGLEIGADDYVTKPFELRELLARVRSVARRTSTAPLKLVDEPGSRSTADVLEFNSFFLDTGRRELRRRSGGTIALTTGEFELLHALAQHPGVVRTRDQLLQTTHHRDAGPFDRTIDVQIGRLRKKLGDDGKAPTLIRSIRGVGYVLTPSSDSGSDQKSSL